LWAGCSRRRRRPKREGLRISDRHRGGVSDSCSYSANYVQYVL
jgi:hypothetical protein